MLTTGLDGKVGGVMPPRASPIVRVARLGDIFPHGPLDIEVLQRQHDPAVGEVRNIHNRGGELLPVVESRRTLPRGPAIAGHDVVHVGALLMQLGALAVFGPLQKPHAEQVDGAVAVDEVNAAFPTAQPIGSSMTTSRGSHLNGPPAPILDGEYSGIHGSSKAPDSSEGCNSLPRVDADMQRPSGRTLICPGVG